MTLSERIRHRRRGQEGQILYLFAGAFVVFVLMAGLVVDAGFAYLQRRTAQDVADLATLAGAQAVGQYYVTGTGTSATVYDAISANAAANNCTASDNCSWVASYVDGSQAIISQGDVTDSASALPSGAVGVRVDVHWPAKTIIVGPVMATMGMQPVSIWDVSTTATGLVASATQQAPAGGLLPLGMYGQSAQSFLQYGTSYTYTITDAQLNTPGNFGWLTWNGDQSSGTVDTSVCTPNNPSFELPSWIQGSTGVKQQGGNSGGPGTTLACLNYYMNNQIPVLIPVYDGVSNGGQTSCGTMTANGSNTEYCIIGVVSMLITNVNWGPGIKSITGTFQGEYTFQPGSVPANAGTSPPALGDQFFYIGLVH